MNGRSCRRHAGFHSAMREKNTDTRTVAQNTRHSQKIIKLLSAFVVEEEEHASFMPLLVYWDAAVVIPRSSASADRHCSSCRCRRRRNITSFVHFWPLSPPL